MSKKSKIINRIMLLTLLTLCLHGSLSFNPTIFGRATSSNIQAEDIYGGIEIHAFAETNTSNTGNWTWALDQPWCSYEAGVYIIKDMIIDNTSVDGTPSGCGIYINSSHDVDFRIQNCTITNVVSIYNYGAGINLHNTSRGVIINNTIDGTNSIGCGIQLQSYNNYNITIEKNIVTDIGRHGILMYGGADIHVLNNTVSYVNYNGIYFYQGCVDSEIAYNFVTDTNLLEMTGQNGGIKLLDDNDNNKVYNNTVLNAWRGIYVRDSTDNTISNNTVGNNYDSGIILSTNSDFNNVTNNIVYNEMGVKNQDYGIWVTSSDHNNITDNDVTNQQTHGLYIYNSKYNNITRNTFNDNDISGIYMNFQCDNNSIQDNEINRNDLGIGLFHSDYNNITANNLQQNGYCIYEKESFDNQYEDNDCSESTILTPIHINGTATTNTANYGNWTWAVNQDWCSGSGMGLDPYIIENRIFSGFGFGSEGILVENSDVFFIIRNCSIDRSSTGIFLKNVYNSQIIGNNCSDNDYGIYLEANCENNEFINNNCSDGYEGGIYVEEFCDHNRFINNICNDNAEEGMYFYGYCFNNTIEGNSMDRNGHGLFMDDYCNNNSIVNNSACNNTGVGIYIYYESDNNAITENTIMNNDDGGIYVYDFCDNTTISGNFINFNNDEGIYFEYDCDSSTISNNTVRNNIYGIYLSDDCKYNTILNNDVCDNMAEGIVLESDCNNNTVSGNLCSNNSNGIYLSWESINNTISQNKLIHNDFGLKIADQCSHTSISGNLFDNNTVGLSLGITSNNITVFQNFFVRNENHAIDDGLDNTWNTPTIGNYWDNWTSPDTDGDGIVDFAYKFIEGSADSIDNRSIAEDGAPQITINSPNTGDRYDDAPSFNVTITDLYVYEMWYTLDGGLTNYTFVENCTIDITAWEALPDGDVTISFYASDIAGNITSEEVTVTKYDAAAEAAEAARIRRIRIITFTIIGVVALLGTGTYFFLKFYKIKLEE